MTVNALVLAGGAVVTEREQVGPPVPPLPSPPSRPSGTELGRLWGGWERSFIFGGGLSGYRMWCGGGVSFSSRVSNAISCLCSPWVTLHLPVCSVAGWVIEGLSPWTAVPAPEGVAGLAGRAQEVPRSPTPMAADPAGK